MLESPFRGFKEAFLEPFEETEEARKACAISEDVREALDGEKSNRRECQEA